MARGKRLTEAERKDVEDRLVAGGPVSVVATATGHNPRTVKAIRIAAGIPPSTRGGLRGTPATDKRSRADLYTSYIPSRKKIKRWKKAVQRERQHPKVQSLPPISWWERRLQEATDAFFATVAASDPEKEARRRRLLRAKKARNRQD